MKRIVRIDRSIGLLQSRTGLLVPVHCLARTRQAPAFSTSIRKAKETSGTDKLRRRLWGTDTPPGQEDPYTKEARHDVDSEVEWISEAAMRKSGFGSTDGELTELQREYIQQQLVLSWRTHQAQGNEGNEEEFKIQIQEHLEAKIRKDNLKGLMQPKKNKSVLAAPGQRFQQMEVMKPAKLEYEAIDVDESSYEAADTWDGLEEIGEALPKKYKFTGFTPQQHVTDNTAMERMLHRAMVEVFTVQQAGKPLSMVSQLSPHDEQLTDYVQIAPSSTGIQLEYTGEATSEKVLQSLSAVEQAEVPTLSAPGFEFNDQVIASWRPEWLQVSLSNPEVKFAVSKVHCAVIEIHLIDCQVLKRVFQLTGKRLSDSKLRSFSTADSLRTLLITPPKPTKVIDALAQKEELLSLPNVAVYAKRISIVDKENSVGRWKVIEQELKARSLPVFGKEELRQGGGLKAKFGV